MIKCYDDLHSGKREMSETQLNSCCTASSSVNLNWSVSNLNSASDQLPIVWFPSTSREVNAAPSHRVLTVLSFTAWLYFSIGQTWFILCTMFKERRRLKDFRAKVDKDKTFSLFSNIHNMHLWTHVWWWKCIISHLSRRANADRVRSASCFGRRFKSDILTSNKLSHQQNVIVSEPRRMFSVCQLSTVAFWGTVISVCRL